MRKIYLGPTARFIIGLILIILFQRLLSMLLLSIGLTGIAYFIVFELILAFVFAYITYPTPFQKGRFMMLMKEARFHYSFALYFVVLIVLELIF